MDKDGNFTFSKIVAIAAPDRPSFTVFPNPLSSSLWIRMPAITTLTRVTIADAKGTSTRSLQLPAGTTTSFVNIADLPAGVYSISFQSNNGNYSRQFIKI